MPGAWRRVCSLRPFRLPGGDKAGREPWRSAAALLWDCGIDWPMSPDVDGLAYQAWAAQLNCPETSAAGRLFDAVAAILYGMKYTSFEAEGPMLLEARCRGSAAPVFLPIERDTTGIWRADWRPLLHAMTDGCHGRDLRAEIFHSSMAQLVLEQAQAIRDEHGVNLVGLSGGVFQNKVLTNQVIDLLRSDDFAVHMPVRLPVNDAGLSFGQVAELAARENRNDG